MCLALSVAERPLRNNFQLPHAAMLLFFLRSHLHIGLYLPQCTVVSSSSKWKHISRAAVQFSSFFFFQLKVNSVKLFFFFPSNTSFISKETIVFVAHLSASCSTLINRELKTWEKKQHFIQQQNANHLWHEAEQLLTNEPQHYTTVNDRK